MRCLLLQLISFSLLSCEAFVRLMATKSCMRIYSDKGKPLIVNPKDLDDDSELIIEEQEDVFGKPPGILPTVSSKINFGDETPKNIQHDLWVVGSGTLGELIIKQWKEKYPDAKIIAETATPKRHPAFLSYGVSPVLRESRNDKSDQTAKNLVICIPPSAAKYYVDEVSSSVRLWAGPLGGGNLVFTSSIGVYGPSLGNVITEDFRVDTRSASSTKLLGAEEAITDRGGNVIRLAGLYTESRGPHSFWFQKQLKEGSLVLDSAADGTINLIHYEDAAAATIALLEKNELRGQICMAADNEPITRKEICASTLASKLYPDNTMPEFAAEHGPVEKVCDCSKTRKILNWKPKYTSFRVFMRRLGGENVEDVVIEENSEESESASEDPSSILWLPGDDDDLF